MTLDDFEELIRALGPSIDIALRQGPTEDEWCHEAVENFVELTREKIWCAVWEQRDKLGEGTEVEEQVFRIAAQVAEREIESILNDFLKHVLVHECSADEQRRILSAALSQLPRKQRIVIELYLQGDEDNWTREPASDPGCPYFLPAAGTTAVQGAALDKREIQNRQNALRVALNRAKRLLIVELRRVVLGERETGRDLRGVAGADPEP